MVSNYITYYIFCCIKLYIYIYIERERERERQREREKWISYLRYITLYFVLDYIIY
jgi:hypothetical protein